MRILKFLALTGILLVTSAFDTFKATFPAICAPSKNAFKEFKEHNYRPILVGNDDEKVLMVFVSDENEAIVTYSVQEKGITCIIDRKSTRLNSSHIPLSRMPSSA